MKEFPNTSGIYQINLETPWPRNSLQPVQSNFNLGMQSFSALQTFLEGFPASVLVARRATILLHTLGCCCTNASDLWIIHEVEAVYVWSLCTTWMTCVEPPGAVWLWWWPLHWGQGLCTLTYFMYSIPCSCTMNLLWPFMLSTCYTEHHHMGNKPCTLTLSESKLIIVKLGVNYYYTPKNEFMYKCLSSF